MAYKSNFTGQEIDDILSSVLQNGEKESIEIVENPADFNPDAKLGSLGVVAKEGITVEPTAIESIKDLPQATEEDFDSDGNFIGNIQDFTRLADVEFNFPDNLNYFSEVLEESLRIWEDGIHSGLDFVLFDDENKRYYLLSLAIGIENYAHLGLIEWSPEPITRQEEVDFEPYYALNVDLEINDISSLECTSGSSTVFFKDYFDDLIKSGKVYFLGYDFSAGFEEEVLNFFKGIFDTCIKLKKYDNEDKELSEKSEVYIKKSFGWDNYNGISIVNDVNELDKDAEIGKMGIVVRNVPKSFSRLYQPTPEDIKYLDAGNPFPLFNKAHRITGINLKNTDINSVPVSFFANLIYTDISLINALEQQIIVLTVTTDTYFNEESGLKVVSWEIGFDPNYQGYRSILLETSEGDRDFNQHSLIELNNYLLTQDFRYCGSNIDQSSGLINSSTIQLLDYLVDFSTNPEISDEKISTLYIKNIDGWKPSNPSFSASLDNNAEIGSLRVKRNPKYLNFEKLYNVKESDFDTNYDTGYELNNSRHLKLDPEKFTRVKSISINLIDRDTLIDLFSGYFSATDTGSVNTTEIFYFVNCHQYNLVRCEIHLEGSTNGEYLVEVLIADGYNEVLRIISASETNFEWYLQIVDGGGGRATQEMVDTLFKQLFRYNFPKIYYLGLSPKMYDQYSSMGILSIIGLMFNSLIKVEAYDESSVELYLKSENSWEKVLTEKSKENKIPVKYLGGAVRGQAPQALTYNVIDGGGSNVYYLDPNTYYVIDVYGDNFRILCSGLTDYNYLEKFTIELRVFNNIGTIDNFFRQVTPTGNTRDVLWPEEVYNQGLEYGTYIISISRGIGVVTKYTDINPNFDPFGHGGAEE